MKPFKFRLKAVLFLRQQDKEKALAKYADAMRRRRDVEQTLKHGQRRIESLQELMSSNREDTFSAREQSLYLSNMQSIDHENQGIISKLEQAKKEEKVCLDELTEARKLLELLKILSDKQKEKHLFEEFKKDEQLVEELINCRRNSMFQISNL